MIGPSRKRPEGNEGETTRSRAESSSLEPSAGLEGNEAERSSSKPSAGSEGKEAERSSFMVPVAHSGTDALYL